METLGERLLRREDRARKRHRRIVGSLTTFLGAGALWVASVWYREDQASADVATLATFGLLQLIGGIPFALGQRWSRLILWPLSAFYLFAFPYGTALGAYTLWVLYSSRRKADPTLRSST